jgi:hypothetical protein
MVDLRLWCSAEWDTRGQYQGCQNLEAALCPEGTRALRGKPTV